MARPSPEPWWLLVSWLSTCSNGRPSRASASSGIPMPVSAMAMLTQPPAARAPMGRRAPSGGGGKRDLLVVGAPRHPAHGVVDERLELDLLGVEPDTAGLDLRHVEDVVDDLQQ